MAKIPPIVPILAVVAALGGGGYWALNGPKLGSPTPVAAAPANTGINVVAGKDAVMTASLASDKQVDYHQLQTLLARRDFISADRETYERLLQAAGPKSVELGFVPQAEMDTLPATDLKTVDNLWSLASHGRFGFTKQEYLLRKANNKWQNMYVLTGWQNPDHSPEVTFTYDQANHRYVYKNGPDPNHQPDGHFPTFERNYNHSVSLDARLQKVGF